MKFLKYIALVFFGSIWLIGANVSMSSWADDFVPDEYRYGDLYRLSNLPQFKERLVQCQPLHSSIVNRKSEIANLYLVGDSFTEKERIDSSFFSVNYYQNVHWNDLATIRLDTTRKNILILETVERHFREHFASTIQNYSTKIITRPTETKTWLDKLGNGLKKTDDRIQKIGLSSDFFLWFKEKKAQLNYRFFGRTSDNVTVRNNQVFYSLDTDSTRINSCFNYLPDNELDKLVAEANRTRSYYKGMGFDEVYLSIIPNKTSILAPEMGRYNRLIERVEQHPNLQVPILSIWKEFNANKKNVYLHSDTHWTCEGQAIWLDKVNKLLP